MGTVTVGSVGERSGATRCEQTRARYPDQDGFIERDGARVFYEVYGEGGPSVLLLTTWEIVHSRVGSARFPTSPATAGW